MSILFAGGEIEDFDIVADAGGVSVNFSDYDATYARSGTDLSGVSQIRANIEPHSEIWVSGQVYKSGSDTNSDCTFMEIESEAGPILRVSAVDSFWTADFERWDGSAWVTVQRVDPAFNTGTSERHVFHVVIGVSGALEWYRNGNLLASYYGDTSALGNPTSVKPGPLDTSAFDETVWSEVIIGSHDVSNARLKTMNLTAAGDLTDWSGAYTDIEAHGSPDTTFVSSGTAGQKSTFQAANLAADTMDVAAVVLSGRVRKGAAGPSGINGVVRIGTTDYTQSLGTLGTVFESKQAIWETDPSTTAKWLRADVEALQVGVESVA